MRASPIKDLKHGERNRIRERHRMETTFLQMTNIEKENTALSYWCVLRRVAGWVAGGCWDDEMSDEMDQQPIQQPCVKRTSKLPSGQRLHSYGKSSLLMGKSTISMGHFQ